MERTATVRAGRPWGVWGNNEHSLAGIKVSCWRKMEAEVGIIGC